MASEAIPGPKHETLVALLQQRPELLDMLMSAVGNAGLPAAASARDSALRVANPLEVRPDVVLLAGAKTGPWTIVEVQLARDDDKQRRWLAGAGVLLDTRGAMGDVVELTHDASRGGGAPVVVDLSRAVLYASPGSPELCLPSVWGHRACDGRGVASVGMRRLVANGILYELRAAPLAVDGHGRALLPARDFEDRRAELPMGPLTWEPPPPNAERARVTVAPP